MPVSPGWVSVAERWRPVASQRPSGDHESVDSAGKSLSFRSDPPTGETRWIVPGQSEARAIGEAAHSGGKRTKAIWRPSGDQLGNRSSAGSVVNRRTSSDP